MTEIYSFFLILLCVFSINLSAKNLGAHVHGSVQIDIATDKNELLIMLNSPSDSFLGFEYPAKSKTEKALVTKTRNEWEKNLKTYLGSDALKDCEITKASWKQVFTGKSHSNISAEAYISCKTKLSGRTIEVSFKKNFSQINEIQLQVLKENGSIINEIKAEKTFKITL